MTLGCARLRLPDDANLHVAKAWTHELSQINPMQQLLAKRRSTIYYSRVAVELKVKIRVPTAKNSWKLAKTKFIEKQCNKERDPQL
jgi:hypothetical protein